VGRETTINVTDPIWKAAGIKGFLVLAESPSARSAAWSVVSGLLASGRIKPIMAKVFALDDAAEALRYLIEERPFGRVVLSI
jgi:NADPH2:quinone reductase